LHQHLDGTLSLRYGPHCVGRYNAEGLPWIGSDRQKAVDDFASLNWPLSIV